MSANPNPQTVMSPAEQAGGVWNRLHSERETISEALLREAEPETHMGVVSEEERTRTANWHRELLRLRLGKVDDALDRLNSGAYGTCRHCGKWIEDTKLEFDSAIAFCLSCWERMQIHINSLKDLPIPRQ